MKDRFTYAGAASLLLTLACSAKVEIGHGSPGAGGEMPAENGGAFSEAGSPNSETGDGGTGADAGAGNNTEPVYSGGPPLGDGPQAKAHKVDLLLAIDNSRSMAQKWQLLAQTIPEFVKRLVNPPCVSSTGATVSQPASADGACPSGSRREFAPVTDLHVGVITSSLGSHGASRSEDACVDSSEDDHARLLPAVRPGLPSYEGKGFLKWDPQGLANPPGEDDLQAFTDSLQTMIGSVGERGCGMEAQLESVYRFLVDPEPPLSIEVGPDNRASPVGIDAELLTQRSAFLRPDSSVVVLMLTDENDCSILDEGFGWLMMSGGPMSPATSQCAADPNDPCCQSCLETEANRGCPELETDPNCQRRPRQLAPEEDHVNLRCFNQQGRFGFDMLYPTSRYVSAFGAGTVRNHEGELVANPLFHQSGGDRHPSLFTLAVVGGVPWQDLATDDSFGGDSLVYLTAEELARKNRWPVILGNPSMNTPPSDPFMRESIEERSGQNPITNEAIVPSSSTDPQANAINGHERANVSNDDLQYACTFELAEPVVCDKSAVEAGTGCDCGENALGANSPVCNPPDGGPATITQHYGKAYPALRELDVASQLGRRTVLGSVCPRSTHDDSLSDHGYRPVLGALGQRVASTLVTQ